MDGENFENCVRYFTNVEAFSGDDGKSLIFLIDHDVNVDTEATYANVQGIYYGGGDKDRGKLYHTLKFSEKDQIKSVPVKYSYKFVVTEPHQNPLPKKGNFYVTIQPYNISHAKLIRCDEKELLLTFSVSDSSLFKKDQSYFITSFCYDKYVEGKETATCVKIGNDNLVTFRLSDNDYREFSIKSHCRFHFAIWSWIPYKTKDWFHFKKSKSLKKRTKTVVKKSSKRRLASPKRVVKSVKKTTKRSRRQRINKKSKR